MSGAARPANVHARSTAAVVASLSIASEARNECSPGGSEATTARARSSCRARSRITTSHPSRASARTAPAPIPAAPPDTSARGRRKFVEECVLAMCHVSHGERTRILLFFPPGVYDVRSDERASKERKEEGGSVGRASRIPPRCTVPHRYRRGARRTRHQTPTTQICRREELNWKNSGFFVCRNSYPTTSDIICSTRCPSLCRFWRSRAQ